MDTDQNAPIAAKEFPQAAPTPAKTKKMTAKGVGVANVTPLYDRMIEKNDANKDGQLTYEEMTAVRPGYPRDAFDQLDSNKDGVISSADAATVGKTPAAKPDTAQTPATPVEPAAEKKVEKPAEKAPAQPAAPKAEKKPEAKTEGKPAPAPAS